MSVKITKKRLTEIEKVQNIRYSVDTWDRLNKNKGGVSIVKMTSAGFEESFSWEHEFNIKRLNMVTGFVIAMFLFLIVTL